MLRKGLEPTALALEMQVAAIKKIGLRRGHLKSYALLTFDMKPTCPDNHYFRIPLHSFDIAIKTIPYNRTGNKPTGHIIHKDIVLGGAARVRTEVS
jgi:hypothetical protein